MSEEYNPDQRLARFYRDNEGKWPSNLYSGVAFYDGLRITKNMFNEYKRWFKF